MSRLDTADVYAWVGYDDFELERERAIQRGDDCSVLRVSVEVDIEDVLEEATVDQLRDALGREAEGYTLEQLDAIKDCFAALAGGDETTAAALLPRIFEHTAQIQAAESGLRNSHRLAA